MEVNLEGAPTWFYNALKEDKLWWLYNNATGILALIILVSWTSHMFVYILYIQVFCVYFNTLRLFIVLLYYGCIVKLSSTHLVEPSTVIASCWISFRSILLLILKTY
jgi:hypothetical protein